MRLVCVVMKTECYDKSETSLKYIEWTVNKSCDIKMLSTRNRRFD